MGMAAGQARLLSITSRLSDNELRAQMINNDKMRLATESSRVSENYVSALNEAQLMFTNYDANNNASYQNLTFNALTSYSPYNNQYGLINSSGNILVSEKDADNFKKANGSVDKFLECYGLEYTTTYFDNLLNQNGVPVGYQSNDIVYYSIGNTSDDGKLLIDQSTGCTASQLEAMYRGHGSITMNGGVTVDNVGYSQIMQDGYYNKFNDLLTAYNDTYDNYLKFISAAMDAKLEEMFKSKFDGKSIEDIKKEVASATDTNTLSGYFDKLSQVINDSKQYAYTSGDNKDKADKWYKELEKSINAAKSPTQNYSLKSDDYIIVTDESNSNFYILEKGDDGEYSEVLYKVTKNGSGGCTLQALKNYDENDTYNFCVDAKLTSGSIGLSGATCGKDSGKQAIEIEGLGTFYECTGVTKNGITVSTPTTPEDMKNSFNIILRNLTSNIYSYWDASNDIWKTSPESKDAYDTFHKAAIDLGKFIYGSSYSGNNPPVEELGNINELYNKIGTSGYPKFDQENNHMYDVFQALLLDAVMNTYGEPNYGWIDTSSRTESYNVNGENKVQWYENLFERMQKGYSVLLDGLASSEEWIQFAFESGIVTMEQVDNNNVWNSLMYTNCSDITEQTNDALITKAEAEYKSAMNKIENKDKRYDLELKNIDTEHNSLQTEYESIKAAIDKNVERTFKLYS